jgi:hypothetical protein
MPPRKVDAIPNADLLSAQAMIRSGRSIAEVAASYNMTVAALRRGIATLELSVHMEHMKQTYRQNLQWAIDAAGEFMRTSIMPCKCPNNAAWFLYVQAIDNPKEFMSKYNQIEKDSEDNSEREVREACVVSIEEIDKILSQIGYDNEEDLSKKSQEASSET